MTGRIGAILLAFSMLIPQTLFAQPQTPVLNSENGHYYQVVLTANGITWDGARTAAEGMTHQGVHGHLATITSAPENTFLTNLFAGYSGQGQAWIGGVQPPGSAEPDKGWSWITAEEWIYSNWYVDPQGRKEPNNSGGNEWALAIYYGSGIGPALGKWNDFDGLTLAHFSPFSYVVEYESDAPRIEIVGARMISSHELQIMTRRDFGDQTGRVTIATTINGKAISVTEDRESNVDGPLPFIDRQPFVLDLSRESVPRFENNQLFLIRASASLASGLEVESNTKGAVILLPVVIVPGIGNGMGGDSSHTVFVDNVRQLTQKYFLDAANLLGESYQFRNGNPGYPTVFTAEYDTSNASFRTGAAEIGALIREALTRTYAEKVHIVTQSKGGLVARQFVVDEARAGRVPPVGRLIMGATPNLGSTFAVLQRLAPNTLARLLPHMPKDWAEMVRELAGADLSNLVPRWPSFRLFPFQRFSTVANPELERLNKELLPAGIGYTQIFAENWDTLNTLTLGFPLVPPAFGTAPGDFVVPSASARGLVVDPNGQTPTYLIPAFLNVPIECVSIPGIHFRYLDSPEFALAVYSRLLSDFTD